VIISLALGAGAFFATAASAAPLSNGLVAVPDSNIENVRMVCNDDGRCWRERGGRRARIRTVTHRANAISNAADIMTAATTIVVSASGSGLVRAA